MNVASAAVKQETFVKQEEITEDLTEANQYKAGIYILHFKPQLSVNGVVRPDNLSCPVLPPPPFGVWVSLFFMFGCDDLCTLYIVQG